MATDPKKYEVGYGKPPEHSRFKKGESGNPKGRPKGAIGFAHIVRKTLMEKIWVFHGDKRKQITKLEASVTQLANKAVKGDARAMQQLLPLAALVDVPVTQDQEATYEVEQNYLTSIYERMREATKAMPASVDPEGPPPARPAKRAPPVKAKPMKRKPGDPK